MKTAFRTFVSVVVVLLLLAGITYTQALFRVQNVNAGAGVTVTHFDATGQTGDVGPQTLIASVPGTVGAWFVGQCTDSLTSLTSTGTLSKCQFNYTDADNAAGQAPQGGTTGSPTTGSVNGLSGSTNAANNGFMAKTGTAITCQTGGYVAGSPTVTFALHCVLIGPYYTE